MMPVSTGPVERSFSCSRRLKTYMRTDMRETLALMTGLALMSIHKDFEIDTERLLR